MFSRSKAVYMIYPKSAYYCYAQLLHTFYTFIVFFGGGVPKTENREIRKNWIIVTFYRFSVNFLFELLLRFIPFEYERGQLGWSVCNEFWSRVQFKIVLSDSNWESVQQYRCVKANSLRVQCAPKKERVLRRSKILKRCVLPFPWVI